MPEANEQQEQWTLLQERIGYEFARPERLAAALTHRSYAVETGATEPAESQRLEFLGDAVLGTVAAEWLVKNVPDWQEGTLTKVRSRLTNGAALARVARQMGLGACLRVGRGVEQSGGREQDSILADALEALMGAVWLDGGVGAIRKIFFRCFAEEIQTAVAAGGDDNPKGDLQEWMQGNGQPAPHYNVLGESGPAHARFFRVAVVVGEEKMGEGSGTSKREAEMNAAREALKHLELTKKFTGETGNK